MLPRGTLGGLALAYPRHVRLLGGCQAVVRRNALLAGKTAALPGGGRGKMISAERRLNGPDTAIGAKPGDKTILDAVHGAAQVVQPEQNAGRRAGGGGSGRTAAQET